MLCLTDVQCELHCGLRVKDSRMRIKVCSLTDGCPEVFFLHIHALVLKSEYHLRIEVPLGGNLVRRNNKNKQQLQINEHDNREH
ncbi:hypothetical protein C0J52_00576 [Blattella germanica]|nr:hypothetical protein C0J52_00576 [Blattella germanica]